MHTSTHTRSHSLNPFFIVSALVLLASVLALPAAADPGDVRLGLSQQGSNAQQTFELQDDYALAGNGWSEGRDRGRYDKDRGDRDRRRYDRQRDRRDRRYERHRDRRRHDHRYERHRDRRRHEHRYDRYRHDRYERHRGRPWAGTRYHRGGFYIHHGRYHGRHFDIPRRIGRSHRHHDYHYGRDYYRPHRHYHEIYLFPSYYDGHVEYRPYAYCGGKLFARAHFDLHGGLVLDFEFNF